MNRTDNVKYYLAAFISLITFVVYLRALQNGFVEWDDNIYIVDNPFIRSLDLFFIRWAFFDFHAGNWHPLTWVSHAVDYALWGLNPFGHHLTNVVLHAMNTCIVVLLVLRLLEIANETTGSKEQSQLLDRKPALLTAGVTGLLFGLHPVHVESVAWVAERKDLLSALFFLLSILAYAKYASAAGNERGKGNVASRFFKKQYLLSIVFFILALLSKPMTVSLPVVLLILDWYPFQRIRYPKTFWTALVEKSPFIALIIFSSGMTILAQKTAGAVVSMKFIPLSARILVAVKSLVAYLWKMLVPLNLIPFYPYPLQVSLVSLEYIVPVVLVVGITATCIFIAGKRQLWLSVWSYHIVTLLLVIGIVQVGSQAMADRYTYLPSLGPFLMIGLLASWVSVRVDRLKAVRIATISVPIFVLTAMTVLAIEQIGIWKSSLSLWIFVIEKESDDPLAYNSRGVAYNRIGLVDKAFQDFNKTIALNPSYYEAYFNRSIVFEKIRQLDKAMQEYDTAVGLNPFYHEAYFNRGMVFQKTGQLDEAIQDFNKVITLDQASYEAYSNLGALYGNAGMLDKALECFNKAILINPNHPTGYLNRGIFYRSTGKREVAIADFQKACYLGDKGGCDALRDPPFTSEDKGK